MTRVSAAVLSLAVRFRLRLRPSARKTPSGEVSSGKRTGAPSAVLVVDRNGDPITGPHAGPHAGLHAGPHTRARACPSAGPSAGPTGPDEGTDPALGPAPAAAPPVPRTDHARVAPRGGGPGSWSAPRVAAVEADLLLRVSEVASGIASEIVSELVGRPVVECRTTINDPPPARS